MATKAPGFAETISKAYASEGPAVELGQGVHDGELVHEAGVRVSVKMANRHGLIAGATGTGKTRTLQGIAEQLSAAGVSVFVADVKGDLSGMAVPGPSEGPAAKRAAELGIEFRPAGFPIEYLALGGIGPGVPVRATVSDFGAQLLSKVLEANETQEQSLGLVFRYADQKGLPLLDLSDLRSLLTFLDSDAGKAELKGIGGLSSQTVGVLLRALVQLEDGGGNELFGEPQFDVKTSCGRPTTAAASSPASSCPVSRTSRSSSRPPSCGCSPSSSRRCPRWATSTSRSSPSSSTRRTCSSTGRARRSWSRSRRRCG
jgi:hypothetical protein